MACALPALPTLIILYILIVFNVFIVLVYTLSILCTIKTGVFYTPVMYVVYVVRIMLFSYCVCCAVFCVKQHFPANSIKPGPVFKQFQS